MVEIRAAKIEDLVIIQSILNYQIFNTCNVYDETPRTRTQMQDWFDLQLQLNCPILVAIVDDEVIGYASYSQFRRWEGYRFCKEHSIYLSQKYRGEGVGTLLLNKLLILAQERGVHSLIAGIDSGNDAAINFHKSNEFFEVARIKEVGYKFDKWLDLVLMQRILK